MLLRTKPINNSQTFFPMQKETVYWTMRNGQQIDVDKMTEEHLRNTLKMLIRNDAIKGFPLYFDKNEDGFDAQGEDIYGYYK